jgi:hypothetical protein
MQLVSICQAVDVPNLLALHFDRKRRTRVNRMPVNEHRASTTGTAVASALVTREIRSHAERIKQRYARLDHQVDLSTVYVQVHGHFTRPNLWRAALGSGFGGCNDGRRQTDDARRF